MNKNNKSSVVAEMGDRLATIKMDRKVGADVPLFLGELGPHLIQCRLGRGVPPFTKWHLVLSNRLATIHQRHRHRTYCRQTGQTDRIDRQRSDGTGRTVLQTVAQKSLKILQVDIQRIKIAKKSRFFLKYKNSFERYRSTMHQWLLG